MTTGAWAPSAAACSSSAYAMSSPIGRVVADHGRAGAPRAAASYLWARLRGDLRHHPQLQLTGPERAVIDAFLADSHRHGLL